MSKTRAFKAAVRWDIPELARVIEHQPELVNATDALGYSLLHRAALTEPGKLGRPAEDALPVADLILQAGADLEAVRMIADDGELFPATPLWCATAFGRNLPLVNDFLRRGAKADWCLWAAVFSADAALLSALLGAKPDLNLKLDGETPFFYAVRLRRFEMARLLAEAGADSNSLNRAGETAHDLARRRGYPKPFIHWLGGVSASGGVRNEP